MVLGVMEEEQEDKKTRRSWADDGKATIELLTHVPLGPVFSDMVLRGWYFFCSEEMGGLCRLAVDQKVVMSDERLSTARVSGVLSNNGQSWLSSRLASCWEAAIIFSGALTDTVAGASLAKTLPR